MTNNIEFKWQLCPAPDVCTLHTNFKELTVEHGQLVSFSNDPRYIVKTVDPNFHQEKIWTAFKNFEFESGSPLFQRIFFNRYGMSLVLFKNQNFFSWKEILLRIQNILSYSALDHYELAFHEYVPEKKNFLGIKL